MAKSKAVKTKEQALPVAGPQTIVEFSISFFFKNGNGIKINFANKEDALTELKNAHKAFNRDDMWISTIGETVIAPAEFSHAFYARTEHVTEESTSNA